MRKGIQRVNDPNPVLYIVFTTGRCNLRCDYCGGSFDPTVVPWGIGYDVDDLVHLVEGDEDPIIAFYGGEPLLNPGFIREVMDSIRARYVIQTNGLLVRALDPEYWRRFDAVLLSIDGVREVTDLHRGRGVYDAVLSAARWLRSIGFGGDLVARMAATEDTDIYRDVTHLLSLGLFDHVHWQLDVVWSDRWRDFDSWAEGSYRPGISRLVKLWIGEMEKGKVLGIAPFQGIARVDLTGRPNESPPCGAGGSAIAISTDGRILACPIAVYSEWAVLGDVRNGIKKTVSIGEPCRSCPYFRYCGGRCLFAYIERYWGEEGFRKVCDLTRHLIDEVRTTVPRIRSLIREGVIGLGDVVYPPFNNTVEIIP